MEKGLPPQYQDESVLQRQRDLHTSLINLGLKLISESYLDVFSKKCREAAVPHECLLLEGKNYYEIIKQVQKGHYDLVIMGALGLAAVNENVIGSVCERVVRRVKTDVLVVKNKCLEGKVVIAVDGSVPSSDGVKSAINFAKSFDLKPTANARVITIRKNHRIDDLNTLDFSSTKTASFAATTGFSASCEERFRI